MERLVKEIRTEEYKALVQLSDAIDTLNAIGTTDNVDTVLDKLCVAFEDTMDEFEIDYLQLAHYMRTGQIDLIQE